MKTTFIYFLKDPENPKKGYVGKSNNPKTRFPQHLRECREKNFRRANWLKALVARALSPVLEIIDEVPFEHWKQCEAAYIEFFLGQGYELTNSTPGGEDPPSATGRRHTPETCAKIGAAQAGEKNHGFGKKQSYETVTKRVSKTTGQKRTPDQRVKLAGTNNHFFGKKHSPVTREYIGSERRGKKLKNNTSGFVGVCWDAKNQSWLARFQIGKKRISLPRFKKIEDAVFAHALYAAIHSPS